MSEQPLIKLQERRDIGQVLNATFVFLRISLKYLYKDMLFVVAPFFILPGILMALQQYSIYTYAYSFGGPRPTLYSSPLYYLSYLCSIIGWALSFAIVCNYVYQYNVKGTADFDVSEIRAAARKDFFKVFFTVILFYLSIIGGMILLIIPGIYFAVANSLGCVNSVLNKDASVGNTFGESRRLVNDCWWRTLGFGIVTALIIYAISMVFSIPSIIYTFLFTFHATRGNPESYRLPFILFSVLAHFAYCLVAPISIVASCIYYYSLKEEKDQVSLVEKIDNLGKNDNEIKVNEGGY